MLQHQSTPSEEQISEEQTSFRWAGKSMQEEPVSVNVADETAGEVNVQDATQDLVNLYRPRRKLPRRSFLRQLNAYWEQPGPLTEDTFAAILSALRDPAPARWHERMLCASLLGHSPLTPIQTGEAAHELGNVLQHHHASRGRRFRANGVAVMQQGFALVAATLALVEILGFLQNFTMNGVPNVMNMIGNMFWVIVMSFIVCAVLLILLLPLLYPILTALNLTRNNRVRTAAALALARLRVPQSVGPLARATVDLSPGVREVAEPALRQVLPTLTPQHYGQLDADTVPALCRLLAVKKERLFANHVHTEQLVLDVLEALGKIGDGQAVAHVASVAEDGWTEAVRNGASAILPILRERQKQETDPRVLLRGASEPPTGSDQLLRAATNTLATAPEQLLRPEYSE